MGGNALKGLAETRRYAADEYDALVPEVLAKLQTIVGKHNRVDVVPAYRNKPSHGDMDLLIQMMEGTTHDFRQAIASTFGVDAIVSDGTETNQLLVDPFQDTSTRTMAELSASGKTYSFAYKGLQIDIIPKTPDEYLSTLMYYRMGDCGNLMGAVVKAMGMELSHKGLVYPLNLGLRDTPNPIVEREWSNILPAFGWNYAAWRDGFDNKTDIFQFVASTPFFNRSLYDSTNRTSKNRTRDAKRPMYADFLEWCSEQPSLPNHDCKEPSHWLQRNLELFPALRPSLDAIDAIVANKAEIKSKYNGHIVSAATGLQGKPLSLFMEAFAESFDSPKDFQRFVLANDRDVIVDRIEEELKHHRPSTGRTPRP